MPDARPSHLVLIMLVVVGMSVPAAALSTSATSAESTGSGLVSPSTAAQNNSSVSVTVGQQLSTVISVSSHEIQTDFQNTAFELEVQRAGEEAQAEAIADRAEDLRERAEAIREDYEEATEAYEAGDLSKSAYAQRLASLNARATQLLTSYEQLSQRAGNVSGLELAAAGAKLSTLDTAVENLSSVTGPGSSALLEQFLGENDGKIEIETTDGLSIEIEREDGESSREFERPRDDDLNITVSHAGALQTARDALSMPDSGHWVLTESKVKPHEGALEFEFVLAGSANLTGEAEVRVDGSTGDIYRLEQETEPRGDHDDEDEVEPEEDDEPDELSIHVVEGKPEPNATITLQVLAAGEPADNVSVSLNDHAVGMTDANGTLVVTLPRSGEAEFEAKKGDAEGELAFEFGDDHDDDSVFRKLNVEATLDGETVTVAVHFDGSAVRNATVFANDDRVGSTNSDGTVTFTLDRNETDELELEVVKGAFEAELTYVLHDGKLALTEEEHEGDGDKAADDERDEEDEQERDDDEAEPDEEEDADDDDENDDENDDHEEENDDEEDDENDDHEGETDDEEDDEH